MNMTDLNKIAMAGVEAMESRVVQQLDKKIVPPTTEGKTTSDTDLITFLEKSAANSGPGVAAKLRRTARRLTEMRKDIEHLKQPWHPMSSAPHDGTEIQAIIPGNGQDNVIAYRGGIECDNGQEGFTWQFTRDQEPPDSWTDGVCWVENDDGQPSTQPIAWKHLPKDQVDEDAAALHQKAGA